MVLSLGRESRSSRYRWVIVASVFVFVLAILFLNASHAGPFIRNLIKPDGGECPPCEYVPCATFDCSNVVPANPPSTLSLSAQEHWAFDAQRDADDYGLTLDQCDVAFPGLFTEIETQLLARSNRPITEDELSREEWPWGTIRCMIYDGHLYILDMVRPDIRRSRQFSVMLAISRALIASREKVPNIEFVMSIEDFTTDPSRPVWAFDRQPDQESTWLMPDFGFWSWPEPGIGTYAEVRKRMEDIERTRPNFADKEPKLFWRGAVVPHVAPVMRQHFIDQVDGQSWSDVKVLNWSAENEADRHRVNIEDHCKYQYLMNTEGRAWSGRLKFIQNCRSVVVAHKLEWIIPHAYLMVSEGEQQNFVQVERDFTDLREKMDFLIAHPEEAERIADNNARTFRDRYLTPAAEACYWRKLFHGWSKVSFEPRFYTGEGLDRKWRGVPFDSYVLMHQLHWEPS